LPITDEITNRNDHGLVQDVEGQNGFVGVFQEAIIEIQIVRSEANEGQQPGPGIDRANKQINGIRAWQAHLCQQDIGRDNGQQAEGQGNEPDFLNGGTIALVGRQQVSDQEEDQIRKQAPTTKIPSANSIGRKADEQFHQEQRDNEQIHAEGLGDNIRQFGRKVLRAVDALEDAQHQRREKEEYQQVPQVQAHPGEVTTEGVPTLEILWDELPEGAGELSVCDAFDVNLDHDVREDAETERDEQASNTLAHEQGVGAFFERVVDGNGREHEKERHDEVVEDGNKHGHTKVQLKVFDVPVIFVEEARVVE